MKLLIFLFLISTNAFSNSSPCTFNKKKSILSCPFKKTKVLNRTVLYSVPEGKVPAMGWPTVILFQGSYFPVKFSRHKKLPMGGFREILLIENLLKNGFAVIAPKALKGLFWETNIPAIKYKKGLDHKFVDKIYSYIKLKKLGPLSAENIFATGISSGGYMTSRMHLSHKHIPFKAFAIQSASYAKCAGIACSMPESVSKSHPPTLFLHGAKDIAVPLKTMLPFYSLLKNEGVEVKKIVDSKARHEWMKEAPFAITAWFKKFY